MAPEPVGDCPSRARRGGWATLACHLRCPASPRASIATGRGSARSVAPWATRQAAVPTTCAGSSVEREFDAAEPAEACTDRSVDVRTRSRSNPPALGRAASPRTGGAAALPVVGFRGGPLPRFGEPSRCHGDPRWGVTQPHPTPGPIRGQLGAGLSLAHPANPAAMVQPSFPVATGACARRPSKPQSWPPVLGWASRRADMDLGCGPTRREAAETLAIMGWLSSPARIVSDPELLRLHPRAAAAPDERRRVHGPARQGQATPPRC